MTSEVFPCHSRDLFKFLFDGPLRFRQNVSSIVVRQCVRLAEEEVSPFSLSLQINFWSVRNINVGAELTAYLFFKRRKTLLIDVEVLYPAEDVLDEDRHLVVVSAHCDI